MGKSIVITELRSESNKMTEKPLGAKPNSFKDVDRQPLSSFSLSLIGRTKQTTGGKMELSATMTINFFFKITQPNNDPVYLATFLLTN